MTFVCTTNQFAGLEKELTDTHQAVMSPAPTASNGDDSGTITHDSVEATYGYSPLNKVLTVNVIEGGNFVVNHVIHSQVQAAINALPLSAPPLAA